MTGRSDAPRDIGNVDSDRVPAGIDAASDTELMARLRQGEIDALGSLYQRYGKMVSCVAAAYMSTSDAGEREDICQEVFLTLRDVAHRYSDQDKLAPFLRGITVRKARAVGRRKWLRSNLLARFFGSGEQTARPRAVDDAVSARQSLARVIDALPVGQREVVVLRFVADMDDIEVAKTLGISRTTVSTRLHRARQTLRTLEKTKEDDS